MPSWRSLSTRITWAPKSARMTPAKGPGARPAISRTRSPRSAMASNSGDVWDSYFDARYGATYYVNRATKATQWDKPTGTIINNTGGAASSSSSASSSSLSSASASSATAAVSSPISSSPFTPIAGGPFSPISPTSPKDGPRPPPGARQKSVQDFSTRGSSSTVTEGTNAPPPGRALHHQSSVSGDFASAVSSNPSNPSNPTSPLSVTSPREGPSLQSPSIVGQRRLSASRPPPPNLGPKVSHRGTVVMPGSGQPNGGSSNSLLNNPRTGIMTWQSSQSPEHLREQNKFLDGAFVGVDSVIKAIGAHPFIDAHPLSHMLFESLLMAREVLNCWADGQLHSVAVESVQHRMERINQTVEENVAMAEQKVTGKLERASNFLGTSEPRTLTVKLDILTSLDKDKVDQTYSLRNVESVEDVYTGHSSEFKVLFSDGSKPIQYRAANDSDKQVWMGLFRFSGQQNYLQQCLNKLGPRYKAQLYGASIHSTDRTKCRDEFVFATSQDHNWEGEDTGVESADITPGLVERFQVAWPQTLGKAKRRDIEVDLSRPHRLRIYKPVKSGKGEMEEAPSMECYRSNLIDYKLDRTKLELEIVLRAADLKEGNNNEEQFVRKLVFHDEDALSRCGELLGLFQEPPPAQCFTLLYQDILNVLDRKVPQHVLDQVKAAPVKVDDDPTSSGVFRGQLHTLCVGMAEMAPVHAVAQQLAQASAALPFDSEGDLQRIKNFVNRLYAVGQGPEQKALYFSCRCGVTITQNTCYLYLFRLMKRCHAVNDFARVVRESKSPKMKAWALRAIWGLMLTQQATMRCTEKIYGMEHKGWDSRMRPFAYYVGLCMQKESVGQEVIDALFEMLIDKVEIKEGESDITPVSVLKKEIQRPDLIPVILHALTGTTTEGCEVGLKNFVLLVQDPRNSSKIISRSGWQNWLYPIILHYFADGDVNNNLFKLAMAVLTGLHAEAILQTASSSIGLGGDGSAKEVSADLSIDRKHIMISSLDKLNKRAGWNKLTVMLASVMFRSLLTSLRHGAKTFTDNLNLESPAYEKMLSLISVVVEYMFFMPLVEKAIKADESLPGQGGRTPLMFAAERGNLQMVMHLVNVMGASLEAQDDTGRTALDIATELNHTAVANFLKKKKAARDREAHGGATSIHLSHEGECLDKEAAAACVELLKALDLHNANSNVANPNEKTSKKQKHIVETGLAWYNFFSHVRDAMVALDKIGVSKEDERAPLIQDISERLYEEQKRHKTGRTKEECDLLKVHFSPWFLSSFLTKKH